MEVSRRTFDELRRRCLAALGDEQLELEARLNRADLDRVSFSRLVAALAAEDELFAPQGDVLDVSQGLYRASVSDAAELRELFAGGGSGSVTDAKSVRYLRKENVSGSLFVDDYGVRVGLSREAEVPPGSADVERQFQSRRSNSYRLKRRVSFACMGGLFRVDCTALKEAGGVSAAALLGAEERYEVELELLDRGADYTAWVSAADAIAALGPRDARAPPSKDEVEAARLAIAMVRGVGRLLALARGTRQVIALSEQDRVRNEFMRLTGQSGAALRLLGPQPVTLERDNMLPGGGASGGRTILEGYSVTDKADGRRVNLFVAADGRGYLIGSAGVGGGAGGRPWMRRAWSTLPAGAAAAERSSVLDCELIEADRDGGEGGALLAFDVYYSGGRDLRGLPLAAAGDEGALLGGGKKEEGAEGPAPADMLPRSRLAHLRPDSPLMLGVVGACETGEEGWPGGRLRARAKRFLPAGRAAGMYREYTSDRGPEYRLDGLIFTPLAADVAGCRGAVFKWKPPEDNSVDFMVQYNKGSRGDPLVTDGCLVARLLVMAETEHHDPLALLAGERRPARKAAAPFRCARLSPDAPDPEVFRAPLAELGGAGLPVCAQAPRDPVADRDIVEFTWDPERGWRPSRQRYDKSAPNALKTATSVWRSIVAPVTLADLEKPARLRDPAADQPSGAGGRKGGVAAGAYFVDDDLGAGGDPETAPMRRFHRFLVRGLFRAAAASARAAKGARPLRLLDLACGRGASMDAYIDAGFSEVVGLDKAPENVLLCYDRLARLEWPTKRKRFADAGGADKPWPPVYAFSELDVARPVADREACAAAPEHPSVRAVAAALWQAPGSVPDPRLRDVEGAATRPFDAVSCVFALHYLFESEAALDGFLDNVAAALAPGGVFFFTCFDGARVADALREGGAPGEGGRAELQGVGATSERTLWRLAAAEGFDAPAGAFGRGLDVLVEGRDVREYLVDFDLLAERLAARGMAPLEPAAFAPAVGGPTFNDAYLAHPWESMASGRGGEAVGRYEAETARMVLGMSEAERAYSFMHRWGAFVKAAQPLPQP